MRVFLRAGGPALALGTAMLLAGCAAYNDTTSWLDRSSSSAYNGIAGIGERVGAPWGGMRPNPREASLTAQRVTGGNPGAEPLLPEPGNVWPEREPPRATLMNPDQALRGIPGYSPSVSERAPPPLMPQATPEGERLPPPRPVVRRGTGGPYVPPPEAAQPSLPPPQAALPPLAPLPPLPERPAGGQVIPTPQGPITPATRSGNVETFSAPGSGVGTVTRDGNTVIINRPGEAPQILPAPR